MATVPQLTINKSVVAVTQQENAVYVEVEETPVVVSTIPQGFNIQLPDTVSSDKHFSQTFTNQTSLVVTHNLAKKPAVKVLDSAGTEYEVKVTHDSINQLTAEWDTVITGEIICN